MARSSRGVCRPDKLLSRGAAYYQAEANLLLRSLEIAVAVKERE
jgi:hypothetical protein